jgi:hypothetical protein
MVPPFLQDLHCRRPCYLHATAPELGGRRIATKEGQAPLVRDSCVVLPGRWTPLELQGGSSDDMAYLPPRQPASTSQR